MKTFIVCLMSICAIALVGCGESNYGGEVKMTAEQARADVDRRIKEIEDNPKMPPQAKEAAIASLKRSAEMGKGQTSPGQ